MYCTHGPLYQVVISCHFNYRLIVFSTLFSRFVPFSSLCMITQKRKWNQIFWMPVHFIVLHVQLWYCCSIIVHFALASCFQLFLLLHHNRCSSFIFVQFFIWSTWKTAFNKRCLFVIQYREGVTGATSLNYFMAPIQNELIVEPVTCAYHDLNSLFFHYVFSVGNIIFCFNTCSYFQTNANQFFVCQDERLCGWEGAIQLTEVQN